MKKIGIEFQKHRDFGGIINATFSFIAQEFKLLIQAIIYFAGPFLLIGAVFLGKGQMNYFSNLETINSLNNSNSNLNTTTIILFVGVFFLLLGVSAIITVINSYISVYTKKVRGNFNIDDIWKEFRKNYFKILGANILLNIALLLIAVISIFLASIPAIYIGVSVSFIFIIQVIEKKTFIEAFSRSFFLIKKKWFMMFGLLMLTMLVIYFISMLASFPLGLIMGFSQDFSPNEGFDIWSIVILVYTILSTMFYYSLFGILQIIIAFQYYNMIEQKEYPGLLKKINEINSGQ